MLRDDVKVAKQVEDRKYEQDGTSHQIIRVEFFVGKHGPFVERFPKADYSAQVRDDRLNAWADQVRTTQMLPLWLKFGTIVCWLIVVYAWGYHQGRRDGQ